MRSFIPNGLTLLNLLMGCLAIYFILIDSPMAVLVCLIISAIADFFDGWAARKLGQAGDLGIQLDSLADVISFGAVPGFIMFMLLQAGLSELPSPYIVPLSTMGFIITLSSAYRLARFNIDTRHVEGFIGLATPANTVFFLGIYLSIHLDTFSIGHILSHPIVLFAIVVLFSYLLNSNIHMFKLKFKLDSWSGFEKQWILLLSAIPLVVFLGPLGLSAVIIVYIILSVWPDISEG